MGGLDGALRFYVNSDVDVDALRTAPPGTTTVSEANADTIDYDGIRYVIMSVDRWPDHSRIVAQRVEGQGT